MPKGHYDRSKSKWTPPPRKVYDPALVDRVREVYASGATIEETAEIVGVTPKVLQRLMPRNGIERRPAIKRNQRGPANDSWKGDQAGYAALHLRVRAERGVPVRCATCGQTDGRIECAKLSGAYADAGDYEQLCSSCHKKFDAKRRRATGRRTMPPESWAGTP